MQWSLQGADKRETLGNKLVTSRNLLQKQAHSLREMATRDELTGLTNRREPMRMIEELVSVAVGVGTTVTVLLLDVDRFKAVNDTHGHDAGDDVLRQLGKAFAETVRHDEIAGRYGGEQFIFALAGTDIEAARQVNRRLRAAAAGVTGRGVPVTVSIGLGCRTPFSNHSLADVITSADQALYQAEAFGRDRSIIHSAGTFPALD